MIPTSSAIAATLERYTYQNPDNDYCVIRLQEKGKRDLATGIGCLPGVPVGSTVRLTGRWVNDRQYGPQFRYHGKTLVSGCHSW